MTEPSEFGNPSTSLGTGPHKLLCLLAVLALWVATADGADPKPAAAPVYVVRDPSMMDEFYEPNPEAIRRNFDLLLATAGGSSDPAVAWKNWIQPGQRIGIKIGTSPGKVMSTHPALVHALVKSLLKAGHSPTNILIFDRYGVEMSDAGWNSGIRPDQATVTSTWPATGYDSNTFYKCSYAGRLIWGDYEFKGERWDKKKPDDKTQFSNLSYFSKIVTDRVDVLINVPVLSSDDAIGLYGSIVNLPLGVIDNQRRFFKPFFGREENIADLASHEAIQGKWVLNIVDGLLVQYAGGPLFDPQYVWKENAIWLSEDPVALDSIALRLINQKRPTSNIKPVDPELTGYIRACEALGVGSTNLGGARLREVPLPAD